MDQWQAAESLVAKWLPVTRGSAESQILLRNAAALLAAVVVHFRLSTLSSPEVARRCRAILGDEHHLSALMDSGDPRVASRAEDAQRYGTSWVKIREPENLVVLTALMNLPRG